MVTVWALVVMLQSDPQVFEFSIVVHTQKECERARSYIKRRAPHMYDATQCIEMKFPKSALYEQKKGGAETPPSRPAKPAV